MSRNGCHGAIFTVRDVGGETRRKKSDAEQDPESSRLSSFYEKFSHVFPARTRPRNRGELKQAGCQQNSALFRKATVFFCEKIDQTCRKMALASEGTVPNFRNKRLFVFGKVR
jgi:hypothetical protein